MPVGTAFPSCNFPPDQHFSRLSVEDVPPCSSTDINPQWHHLSESVLLNIAQHLRPESLSKARLVCKHWRQVFSLPVTVVKVDLKENCAHLCHEFVHKFRTAFPSTSTVVIGLSFRRVARERIQATLDAHFAVLKPFDFEALQLHLDLNSFNERKVKLPDLYQLASWNKLTTVIIQESGWRSQQLRVQPNIVFDMVPRLQTLTVTCKHSSAVKSRWFRAGVGQPVLTEQLRCLLTQNQSVQDELQKALKHTLASQVQAVTFEVVEETYVESNLTNGPVDVSSMHNLRSFTLLSGAEDALSHSRLELVGASQLEALTVYDLSTGRWCYSKPGHGVPQRLLHSHLTSLKKLVLVGFVLNQTPDLGQLSCLLCLEELRVEQPETDSLATVSGDMHVACLPPSLKVLKLYCVVIPPSPLPAHLPALRELYLSRCRIADFAVFRNCGALRTLAVMNCVAHSNISTVLADPGQLNTLALIHSVVEEVEWQGLPAGAGMWCSDEQLAELCSFSRLTSLQLVLTRGDATYRGLDILAGMSTLQELDLHLPCLLSEVVMPLARLKRLRRLTLWVDSRVCLEPARCRQLQAIQRNLQAHMPSTEVEWMGAEARYSTWTGLEAQVFPPC